MDKETKKEFELLGRMIKKGFDDVDKRFIGVDKRFIGVDKRFDGVDKRFDGVDKRFDGVDKRFDRVEARLDNLENGQEEIKLKLDNTAYRFELEDLKKRVKKTELKLKFK